MLLDFLIYWTKFVQKCAGAAIYPEQLSFTVANRRFKMACGWTSAPPLQQHVDDEIAPLAKYFEGRDIRCGIDAGAAIGMFSIPLLLSNPHAILHTFEPSLPNRILLRRNARINKVESRLRSNGCCLWNEPTVLVFRSHGYIGGVQGVSEPVAEFPAKERVRAITLDEWWNREGRPRVDFLKMDIEGAEVEAIEGASRMLVECRPLLLVEAYHLRNGQRTFGLVRQRLENYGFDTSASVESSGLIVARVGD